MQRVPIRVKVAGSLALPLLALLGGSAFEVLQAADAADQVRDETDLATAVTGPAGVINTLHDERSWASVEVSGLSGTYTAPVEGYGNTRRATDRAIRAFREDVASKGGAVGETFGGVLEELEAVEDIRSDLDAFDAPRSLDNMQFSTGIYDRYTEIVQALLEANAQVTGQVQDDELRQGVELAVLAAQQIENEGSLGRDTVTMTQMSPGGLDTSDEIARIASLLSAYDRVGERLLAATGRYADVVRERYPRDHAARLRDMVEGALETGRMDDIAPYMELASEPPEHIFPGLRDALIDEVVDRAETLNDRATTRQWVFVFLAAVALLVAGVLTWIVSRSITAPMRSLTRQAREMANARLPGAVQQILDTPPGEDVRITSFEPIDVQTRDEVADVVQALNTVQESALNLAVEQAVLRRNIADSFVSLGRRNQNLLGRQLDFITELESNETDPDSLAGLFRLDHLATRMRRNAESLLVLAGVEPPRKWAAPVRITDVIRAALGEVESFQRVRVAGVEPVTILGSVAADLAHLLAELVENSLTFSPPDEDVGVYGEWRDQEGYRITIVDNGLGMPPDAIEQANARLAGVESLTVAPSKYLGHHVAGSLAARHGIRVRLDARAPRGIRTTVELPRGLTSLPGSDDGARQGSGPAGGQVSGWAGTGAVPAGHTGNGGHGGYGGHAGNGGHAGTDPGFAPLPWPAPAEPVASLPAFRPDLAAATSGMTGEHHAIVPAPPDPQGWRPPGEAAWGEPPGAGRAVSAPGGWSAGEPPPPAAPPRPAPAGGEHAPPPGARGSCTTAGGLPKRSRTAPTTTEQLALPGDLLAALESHTRNAGPRRVPGPGRAPGPVPPPGPPPGPPPPPWAQPAPPVDARGAGAGFPTGIPAGGPPPAPGAAPGSGSGSGSEGNLPRRVRGAQLPTMDPRPLRRYQAPVAPPAPPGQGPGPVGHQGGGSARADEVYTFLSGFSAGVQRGLDEARRTDER